MIEEMLQRQMEAEAAALQADAADPRRRARLRENAALWDRLLDAACRAAVESGVRPESDGESE